MFGYNCAASVHHVDTSTQLQTYLCTSSFHWCRSVTADDFSHFSEARFWIVGSEEARVKRWPPSAAQTARTVFPYAAFTKTQRRQDAREGVSYGDLASVQAVT